MDETTETRLRDHIAAIVARSGLPPADRDDVAEELLGHLVTRTAELVADGLSEEDAASRAIAEFGGVDDLAPDFRSAYHSRLWASTLGVMLPSDRMPEGRPMPVTALAALTGVTAFFGAIGTFVVATNATPIRAVLATPMFGIAAILDWLATLAILAGQRWGFLVGLFVTVVMLLAGLGQMTSGPGTTISLSGIAAAVTLIAIAVNGEGVDRWFAESGRLPAPTAAAVGVFVAVSTLVGLAPGQLPDPTQIGPQDITATAAVSCRTVPEPGLNDVDGAAELDPNARQLEIDTMATVTWHRTDWYPKGFSVGPEGYGDAVAFLADVPSNRRAAPILELWPQDVGVEFGSWASSVPEEVSNMEAAGGDVRGIDGQIIRAGSEVTVRSRLVAHIVGDLGQNIEPPSVEVSYWHLDRFRLRASVSCGQEAQLSDEGTSR